MMKIRKEEPDDTEISIAVQGQHILELKSRANAWKRRGEGQDTEKSQETEREFLKHLRRFVLERNFVILLLNLNNIHFFCVVFT